MSIIIKSGNSSDLLNVNPDGSLLVSVLPASTNYTEAPWTSATPVDTEIMLKTWGDWPSISVQFNQTSGVSSGAITFEGTYDGFNWIPLPNAQVLTPVTLTPSSNPYNFQGGVNHTVFLVSSGYLKLKARLSTAITSTISVTLYWTLLSELITSGNVTVADIKIADGDGFVRARPQAPTTAIWSHAIINVSAASGTQTLIASSGTTTIRVMKVQFTTTAATNVYFLDSTPTTLSGTYVMTGNGSSFADFGNGEPLWVGAAGKAFQINLSATATLGGDIWYSQS